MGETIYFPDDSHTRGSPVGTKIVSRLENAFGESETGVTNDVIKKSHRTKGLWIFDNVLFNITNLAVFAFSVFATYKTNFSQSRETPKELQNWWMRRGNEAVASFKKIGMNEESARNANMVLWSFVDGTIAAPFVAMLEHRRNKIGKWIDEKLGTKPENPSIYKNQPKEGWKSVLTGRLAAFSIVTPTYFLLNAKDKKDPSSLSLNNILFDKTADAIVEHNIAGIPGALEKHFPKAQVKGLVNTAVFEIFYCTLCTSILFAVSFLAGKKEQRKKHHHAPEGVSGAALPNTELKQEGAQEALNAHSHRDKVLRKALQKELPTSYAQTVISRRSAPDLAMGIH